MEKLLIHDLTPEELKSLAIDTEGYRLIDANEKAAPCQGCFGCWLKTPGKCVYGDRLQDAGALLPQSEEIAVISSNYYGGYSPGVKRVFDRSIAGSLPLFVYRSGKVHHPRRYKVKPILRVYFYGDITETEKQIAAKLVQANAVNMDSRDVKCFFSETLSAIKENWQ